MRTLRTFSRRAAGRDGAGFRRPVARAPGSYGRPTGTSAATAATSGRGAGRYTRRWRSGLVRTAGAETGRYGDGAAGSEEGAARTKASMA